MTMASKYHAEACYCLGTCYEEGIGVDVADRREAIKYYRKAFKLGYRKAAAKVTLLEKELKAEEVSYS
jgi:TPR repeat protein